MARSYIDTQMSNGILAPNNPSLGYCVGSACPVIIKKGKTEKVGGVTGKVITTATSNLDGTTTITQTFVASGTGNEGSYAAGDSSSIKLDPNSKVSIYQQGKTQLAQQTEETKQIIDANEASHLAKMDSNKKGTELNVQDGASANGSLVKQPTAAKELLKIANKADKKKTIQKKDIYPTVATGSALKTYPDAATMVADYYRFGKFTPGEKTYEIPPKQFTPIVNEKVPSSIRIIGQDSKTNKPSDLIPAYTKFILETVQESHTERSQIVETFGDFYVFMFGERPPIYNFTGQLVNSQNANWVMDFMFMYNEYLRGTRCVERNAKVLLTYGGRQIEGLILNTASQTNAAVEGAVGFSFSVVVFERKYFNFSPDMGYYTSDNETLTEDSAFRKTLGFVAGPSGKGTSDVGVSTAINKAKEVATGGPAAGASYGQKIQRLG